MARRCNCPLRGLGTAGACFQDQAVQPGSHVCALTASGELVRRSTELEGGLAAPLYPPRRDTAIAISWKDTLFPKTAVPESLFAHSALA